MCVNIPGEPQGEGTAGSAEGEWGWMAPQGKRAAGQLLGNVASSSHGTSLRFKAAFLTPVANVILT